MELHGRSIIAGEIAGGGTDGFEINSRLDGTLIAPRFFNATDSEVSQAAIAADAALAEYQKRTAEQRAAFLEKIGEEILALGDALLQRANAETALPEARLTGERARTIGQLKLFADAIREGSWVEASIDRPQPERKPLRKPDLRRMLVPIGPVAVFGASNFPFAFSVAGGDTASALAAGCPVIVKAHPAHPGTSEMVARAVTAAAKATGMPAGVFSMIHGNKPQTSIQLVTHPAIKAVGFTGSLRAGRAIYDAAAARPEPIPVYAEMGSTNPIFILPEALKQRGAQIAEGLVQSVTMGVGQFCTNPGLAFALAGGELESLQKDAAEHAAKVAGGTMLHDGICEQYHAGVEKIKQVPGVKMLTEAAPAKTTAPASVFATDTKTFLREETLQEELFGPATLIVACQATEDFIAIANALSGQLTATIHGTDEDLKNHCDLIFALSHKVGRLLINGFPTGVEVCASMQHGGPYPATTDSRSTSVGTYAIKRFARPLAFQNFPDSLLPAELRNENGLGIWRLVDNQFTRDNA